MLTGTPQSKLSTRPSKIEIDPASLNDWFPLERQNHYVLKLTGRHGLTRRRAEYFIRLWGYLLLKQQQQLQKRPSKLTELYPLQGTVPCTHREASELFYAHKERGSDRAAGMMLDQFANLGLIKKNFDGNNICLQIRPLPDVLEPLELPAPAQLECDVFNPRTDAVSASHLIIRNYSWLPKEEGAAQKIIRLLRDWAGQYQKSMRVLRRCDNGNIVGFYMLYPTARESEVNFFLSPSKSIYLTSESPIDPLKMALPGDSDCTATFIRAWTIDAPYLQPHYICQLVEDVQQTLIQMQQDFPNLCDVYGMVLHPIHEKLRLALGFDKTCEDHKLSLYWIYQPLDRFLALNATKALANLKLDMCADDS